MEQSRNSSNMVRRLQVKANEGLRGGCRHSVYKRISLLKSDAGPCDGLGGCSPCLPQSHLTESQMADFHDKPGRNPPQTTHLFIFRAWPCWPFTTFYMLGWSLGPSAGRFGFLCLRLSFVSNKTKYATSYLLEFFSHSRGSTFKEGTLPFLYKLSWALEVLTFRADHMHFLWPRFLKIDAHRIQTHMIIDHKHTL